jgi:hypothetical protein
MQVRLKAATTYFKLVAADRGLGGRIGKRLEMRGMIRLVAVACIVGAMAAVGFAQHEEEKLLTVETLPPEPTVIMSGDPVKITYRVRFPELVHAGREIIILEDRMTPESLSVHPFEATGLAIEKRAVRGGHVWDFVYSLRLINVEKSSYTIPPVAVYWLVRDFGEAIEEAEVQQVESQAAPVRYVSTITDSGPLDIRDTIDLGEYESLATAWTTVAWVVSPLPLLLWILYAGRLSRRPRAVSVKERTNVELEHTEGQLALPPSVRMARRQLRRTVLKLRDSSASEDDRALRALDRDLVISIREYLHAELPDLNTGDTAREIKNYVETRVPRGGRREALLALASRLVVLQRRLEHGASESIPDPVEEARVLEDSVNHLRPHVRVWREMRNGWRRGR